MLVREYQSLPESQCQTTPPQSPRRTALSSPDLCSPPSTTWYIILVEHLTVYKELSSVFAHLSLTKGPEADRAGVVLIFKMVKAKVRGARALTQDGVTS